MPDRTKEEIDAEIREEAQRRFEMKWTHSWERLAVRVFLCVSVVLFIIGAIVLNSFGDSIQQNHDIVTHIESTQQKSKHQRQEFQAEQNFQHCSSVSKVKEPTKAADLNSICKHYKTLKQAYEYEATR